MTDKEREAKINEVKSKYNVEWWNSKDSFTLALYQLNEPILIISFSDFHKAVEESMHRPVYTHEFVNPKSLIAEMMGDRPEKDIDEIMKDLKKLAGDKPIISINI